MWEEVGEQEGSAGENQVGQKEVKSCVVCEAAASFLSQMSRGHLGTRTPRWKRVANQAVNTEMFWAKMAWNGCCVT